MKNISRLLLIALLPVLFLSGCIKLALQFSPDLISNLSNAIFEECDPQLAKESLPADLKLMEGLLKNDSGNKQILSTLCMGFTGYSMLFVEEDDKERASLLYLRARKYGFSAIGLSNLKFNGSTPDREALKKKLIEIGKDELEALFWTTMAWNLWININLDKPFALAQLQMAQACLNRVMDIKPDFFYGTPYIMMGTILASKPPIMGGSEVMSKEYFEKAMELTQGNFYMTRYFFAKHYAVRTQNKELFFELTRDSDSSGFEKLKDVCLVNAVMKEKIRHLRKMSQDLFL
ncbi:MAG TPA: TRAP transporter TatT component family protein [Desulfobacteraceae bacterium]|nr:TRAP transporter TatT component family protein [Desulfobacteraceae bacterium]HPJ66193.1 TRAP transporter TatT component family protein [Desulfobacteraceae bacterium]HPQ27089.1 TRAP transporter TatT component family protein [Desulfobacteraceae bacterium]